MSYKRCPHCGKKRLIREPYYLPEWMCTNCLEAYTDFELAEYDREPVWEYNREEGNDE